MRINYIDNYDSFANTIAAYFRNAGAKVEIYKSDCNLKTAFSGSPDLILLGPGPNGPRAAGNYMDVMDKCYHKQIPVFGICLGFQTIMEYSGQKVMALDDVVHGKAVDVLNTGEGIFEGIDTIASFARYNSLGVRDVPNEYEITGITKSGIIMAAKHKTLPIEGVQFHPESVLSQKNNAGIKLIENVVSVYSKNKKVLR